MKRFMLVGILFHHDIRLEDCSRLDDYKGKNDLKRAEEENRERATEE